MARCVLALRTSPREVAPCEWILLRPTLAAVVPRFRYARGESLSKALSRPFIPLSLMKFPSKNRVKGIHKLSLVTQSFD